MPDLKAASLAPTSNGQGVPSNGQGVQVQFRNCRHGFGDPLTFDVVVDGIYPDRSCYIWLYQAAEIYKGIKLMSPTAHLNLPKVSLAQVKAVLAAVTPYHLCNVFRKGESITAVLCGPDAPDFESELLFTDHH